MSVYLHGIDIGSVSQSVYIVQRDVPYDFVHVIQSVAAQIGHQRSKMRSLLFWLIFRYDDVIVIRGFRKQAGGGAVWVPDHLHESRLIQTIQTLWIPLCQFTWSYRVSGAVQCNRSRPDIAAVFQSLCYLYVASRIRPQYAYWPNPRGANHVIRPQFACLKDLYQQKAIADPRHR